MATDPTIPDLSAHLDAAERAGAAFRDTIQAALDAIPEDPRWNGVRGNFVESLQHVKHALDFRTAVALLAEAARPKGTMVEIIVPGIRRNGTATAELESITSGAFVMRGGERYSRKNGEKIGSAYSVWRGGAPYIAEEERARLLALPRPSKARK